ncbi:hypothetical protein [Microcoleus sp. N3A4]
MHPLTASVQSLRLGRAGILVRIVDFCGDGLTGRSAALHQTY